MREGEKETCGGICIPEEGLIVIVLIERYDRP